MTSITFFCHACQSYRAVEIEPVSADDLNPEPWGDIVCATCGFVIATISGPPGVYRVCRVGDGDDGAGPAISSVASGIAALILKRRLDAGKSVEIPSLGITIEGDSEAAE